MKNILRKQMLSQLREQDQRRKRRADDHLMEVLLASRAYQEAQVLATYLSLEHEVATQALLEQGRRDGKRILVPKVVGPGEMVFVDYDRNSLVPGAYGILEPAVGPDPDLDLGTLDLIHVPGLVFNPQGYRIGYGGGYYDRILAHFDGVSLSTAYGFQVQDFEPQVFDKKVKELIIDETTI